MYGKVKNKAKVVLLDQLISSFFIRFACILLLLTWQRTRKKQKQNVQGGFDFDIAPIKMHKQNKWDSCICSTASPFYEFALVKKLLCIVATSTRM